MSWFPSSSLRHAGCGLLLSRLARHLLCIAGWLGLAGILGAEPLTWNARNWHTEHGLPDPCVTAIAQTRDGYLWLGTPKGLVRFDGMKFRVFEVAGGQISALLVDRRGLLWLATRAGRLLCREDGQFREVAIEGAADGPPTAGEYLKDETGRSLPLPAQSRPTLAEDAAGGIWLQVGDRGLWSCDGGKATRHTDANGLPAGRLSGLCADGEGQIWLVAGQTLLRRDGGSWVRSEAGLTEGRESPLVQAPPVLTPARAGGIWVAAPHEAPAGGGRLLRRYEPEAWREQLEVTPWTPNSMRSEVTALMGDRSGRVWLGLLWNGIWLTEPGGRWQRVEVDRELTHCVINCLFEDRRGTVWVGTDREGLHCLSRRPASMLMLPEAARDSIITTSCTTRDGSMWVGTDGAGAFRYRAEQISAFAVAQGLVSPHVCSLFEDRQGTLWAGTWGGLCRFDGGCFTRIDGPSALGQAVLALFEDHAGRLWVGTQGALVCLEEGQWSVRKLVDDGTPTDIRALAEDGEGSLWVGTIGQGLFRLNHGHVTRFRDSGGFPGQDARSLYCDPEGRSIWIGTMKHGLVRFHEGRFTSFGTADGLPCDTIGTLIPDGSGNLWMGTENGIFGCPIRLLDNYRPGTSPSLLGNHLTSAEGLLSRTLSGSGQPVPCRTTDGRLWFPNYRGLAGFNPAAAAVGPEPPGVLIESVAVDGADWPEGNELSVSSIARRFEFHFTAPDLVAPQALRFRYRLEGMDPGWVDAGNQRSATYSQLPPGSYRFRVMAGGPDGRWHEAAAPLAMRIVPRVWERSWVRWLAGIVLACALAGMIVLNERRKHRRRLANLQQARALEQERQRIAANIHDDLGASLTRITLLTDLARERAEAGGIGAEIEQIHTTSRNLTRAMDEVVWAIAPEHDTLDSLVTYLGKLAQDLLRAAGVRCRLEIPATLPELGLSGQARHSLLLAAKEALHNVVKHSGASEARVQASLGEDAFLLSVADNGCGFEPTAAGGGHGLGNMEARLRDIGGRCQVSSTPGRGTEVRFHLPLRHRGGASS